MLDGKEFQSLMVPGTNEFLNMSVLQVSNLMALLCWVLDGLSLNLKGEAGIATKLCTIL
jgi:hypothetical protein